MKFSLIVLLLAVISGSALAQSSVKEDDFSTTLSTAPKQCVSPDSSIKTLSIQNLDAAINIGYCFRNKNTPSVACTPTVGTAGTYTVGPGSLFYFSYGGAPTNGLDCVAASGTPNISISVGH